MKQGEMMSSDLKIEAQKREGKAPKGAVPGVVYGTEVKSTSLSFDELALTQLYAKAGTNNIVDLKVGDEDHEVLFKEVDINSVTRTITHVDLYAIKRGQKVTATTPLKLIGESEGESKGLIIVTFLDEVEVETVPRKLPSVLEISKEALVEPDDLVRISDIIDLDSEVEIKIDPETVVAKLEEPRAAAAEEATDEETEGEGESEGAEGGDSSSAEEKPSE